MQYEWKRFWCPPSEQLQVDEHGYVVDPIPVIGPSQNPNLVSLVDQLDTPCLVLLGEPGIGKSTEFKLFYEYSRGEAEKSGNQTILANLHDFPSEYSLNQFVFDSTEFQNWINGNSFLTLFLDSLDEGLLSIKHLANYIAMRLERLPITRLKVRIACRTLDWPELLTNKLQSFWGKDNLKILELVPLRRRDVQEAAVSEGINPELFLKEIEHKEVVPFAIKPVTLRFLFGAFQSLKSLPGNKADLYLSGCLNLCEETSESRIASQCTGNMTTHQRMKVAGRIAAIITLSNRAAIWNGLSDRMIDSLSDRDISVFDLSGKTELINGDQFQVSEKSILETLSTGLFSSRGSNRMGLSHQTYAEFLTAWYLYERNTPLAQIKSLILHPLDPEGKFVPQLFEVAAWLAGLRSDVFDLVAQREPVILFRGDISALTNNQRSTLIEALLHSYENGERLEHDWNVYKKIAELSHPTIANQLTPYILDKTKNSFARYFAIDLAESCSVAEVQDILADIVLDQTEKTELRTNAGWAVARIGSKATKKRLLPFIHLSAGDDPEDEFKGIGLMANWPDNISSEELFSVLTKPQDESYYGAYSSFLSSLIKNISKVDIIDALNWIAKYSRLLDLPIEIQDLYDAIMVEGWNQLDQKNVIEIYSKVVLARLSVYGGIVGRDKYLNYEPNKDFAAKYEQDNHKRRFLIRAVLKLISNEKNIEPILYTFGPLFLRKDFRWMISMIKQTKNPIKKRILAVNIRTIINWENNDQLEIVFKLMQTEGTLQEEFLPYFGPILLDSKLAESMKKHYWRTKERGEKNNQEANVVFPPIKEQIETLIKEFERGDLDAWWRLNLVLLQKVDGYFATNEYEYDILKMPGWELANDGIKHRLLQAAKKYIYEKEANIEGWLGKENIIYRPEYAAFRALYLLYQLSSADVTDLPSKIWQKWAPIVLGYPVYDIRNSEDVKVSELLKLAYKNAQEEILKTIQSLINPEKIGGNLRLLERIDPIFDLQIQEKLSLVVRSEKLKPEYLRVILNRFFSWNKEEAENIARSMVIQTKSDNEELFEKGLIGADALLFHTKNSGWEIIWPLIISDEIFGKKLILNIAFQGMGQGSYLFSKLTPTQLVDFYSWLVGQFPPSEDPIVRGGHSVSPREEVADFRDRIPRFLARIGTQEAYDEFENLIKKFPDIQWLANLKHEANTNLRRNTWSSPLPSQILSLLTDPKNRQVENGEQLLDLLIESLNRLEQELQGETPSVLFLWNEWPIKDSEGKTSNIFRPKSENRLSDFVKLHLIRDIKDQGLIINREVEIRPTIGSTPGEETDITVDAARKNPITGTQSIISVIIETKCCWNNAVDTAMRAQLVDRYLSENQCKYGLYLVGWYRCTQWDDEDYRKNRCKYGSIDEARRTLNEQADQVSKNGIKIKAVTMDLSLR